MTASEGIVYLLHFERAYKGRSRHYLGFTRNLEQRLENHRRGTACVTTKLAFDRGIGFTLARTWAGTAKLERQIKSHGVVNCCPICPARPGRESAASNLIGAKGFAVEDHSQEGRAAPSEGRERSERS